MGKRNIRIRHSELKDQLPQFVGKQVHIVTRDDRTFFGKLMGVEAENIVVRDVNAAWYNRKRHTHHLPFSQIREAITDLVTEY